MGTNAPGTPDRNQKPPDTWSVGLITICRFAQRRGGILHTMSSLLTTGPSSVGALAY